MEYILDVLLLLVLARAFGEVAHRLGQPASFGELAAGILLAAAATQLGAALPFLHDLARTPALEPLAQLGIFFLVLLAGLEMEPQELKSSSFAGGLVALGGVLLPLAAGMALAWWALPETGLRPVQALAVGVALSITAIPAVVKVFTDFDMLRSRVAEMVVTAAVFDDVIGLFLLAILTAFVETGHYPGLAALLLLLGKVAAFFAVTVLLGVHVYPRVHRHIKTLQVASLEISALVVVALAYGALAEALGMHWILGAFMAGLFFEKSRVGAQAYVSMKLIVAAVSSGILGPLFFLWIGLQVDLGAIAAVPGFLLALVLTGFLAKALGAGLPAYWLGLGPREAASVGVAMTSRGAVELVAISIVAAAGLFDHATRDLVTRNLFSALVIMAVLNTLVMPLALGRLLPPSRRRTLA